MKDFSIYKSPGWRHSHNINIKVFRFTGFYFNADCISNRRKKSGVAIFGSVKPVEQGLFYSFLLSPDILMFVNLLCITKNSTIDLFSIPNHCLGHST